MKIRYFLLALPLLAASLFGQSSTAPACPGSPVTAGVPFSFAVTLAGQAQANTQFSLSLPASATSVNVTAGTSATTAAKSLSFSNNLVVLTGSNNNLMQPGTLANVALTIPAPGSYSVGVVGPIGTDTANPPNSIATTVTGSPCSVTVVAPISLCDLNSDGSTNSTDLSLIVSWVLGTATPPSGKTCDKNADSSCNVLDVAYVVQATLGNLCKAAQ